MWKETQPALGVVYARMVLVGAESCGVGEERGLSRVLDEGCLASGTGGGTVGKEERHARKDPAELVPERYGGVVLAAGSQRAVTSQPHS